MNGNKDSQINVIMRFPAESVGRPLTSVLVRDFNVDVNILYAQIDIEKTGHMFIGLAGSDANIQKGIQYLRDHNVEVIIPKKNLIMDEDRCVHCGACLAHCSSGALYKDENHRTCMDIDQCMACESCVPACGYGAIESISTYLKKKKDI